MDILIEFCLPSFKELSILETFHYLLEFASHGQLICDVLRDLVPFAQFKNMKNTHGGVLLLVKLQAKTLLHGSFSRFLNCTNGTKLRKTSHMSLSFLAIVTASV